MGEDEGAGGNELVRLLEPFWSAERTMEALGLDGAGLQRAAEAGEILQLLTSDGGARFLVFQFVRSNEVVRVWPGLRVMLRVLKDEDQWSVALLLKALGPVEELGGRSVLDAVRAGIDDEALERYADLIRREWR
jgi:hypothetical protein